MNNKKLVCNNCIIRDYPLRSQTFKLIPIYNNRFVITNENPVQYINKLKNNLTPNVNLNTNRANCGICETTTKQQKLTIRKKPTPWRMPYNHNRKKYVCQTNNCTNVKVIKETVDKCQCPGTIITTRFTDKNGISKNNSSNSYKSYLYSRAKLFEQSAQGLLPENRVENLDTIQKLPEINNTDGNEEQDNENPDNTQDHICGTGTNKIDLNNNARAPQTPKLQNTYYIGTINGTVKNIQSGTEEKYPRCELTSVKGHGLNSKTFQYKKMPIAIKKQKPTSSSSKSRLLRLKYQTKMKSTHINNSYNNCSPGDLCQKYITPGDNLKKTTQKIMCISKILKEKKTNCINTKPCYFPNFNLSKSELITKRKEINDKYIQESIKQTETLKIFKEEEDEDEQQPNLPDLPEFICNRDITVML